MPKARPKVATPRPSASDKWLHCPGWLQAVVDVTPEPPSEYAREGTSAHRLLELCGEFDIPPATMIGRHLSTGHTVDDEMAEAVAVALRWIDNWLFTRPDAEVHREVRLTAKIGPYIVEGTSDAVLWSERTRELVTFDYKHGAGKWVDAVDNTQILTYTLGAVQRWPAAKHVTGVIAQPRAIRGETEAVREWPIKLQRLRRFEAEAREALHLAHEPGARRIAGGHCGWCPLAGTCRELAEYNLRTASAEFTSVAARDVIEPSDPSTLTADELAYVLSQVYVIEGWLRSIESEAVRRLMSQLPVPGYKLTRGRSSRSWVNEERVVRLLVDAFDADKYAPRSLLSPARIEKLVKGHPDLAQRIAQLIVKSDGAPHIAPENDPRPALPGSAAFDFERLNTKS
jgi:hypothetical protein